MIRWALIINGVADRFVEADVMPPPPATVGFWVDGTGHNVGDAYTGGAWGTNSVPLVAAAQDWWVTPAAFWARWGADFDAVVTSSADPCRAFVAFVNARSSSGFVDLQEPALKTRLNGLIAATLPASNPMTAAKRDAICDTVPSSPERLSTIRGQLS